MKQENHTILYALSYLIIVLSIVVTVFGVFYTTGGKAYEVSNQYGDIVKIYGDGIYAHDSYFKAPIFRGTDFTILFIAVPLMIVALILDRTKKRIKQRMFLTAVIAIFVYYSASSALGITYNVFHLVYIALLSTSFFALILSMTSIDLAEVENNISPTVPYRGFYVFLGLTGVALIVAWLPDIVSALIAQRPLALIEIYTTEITNVLDMGIISPVAFICLYTLKQRRGIGYVILEILLTVCVVIGIMLPIQSVFQQFAGIELPAAALISKVAIFCLLALSALYFNIRLLRSVKA